MGKATAVLDLRNIHLPSANLNLAYYKFDGIEILRANAKPLAQRSYTLADNPNYRGILDPTYADFIGEQGGSICVYFVCIFIYSITAILHRAGWQEISRMRHYMK